MVAERSVEERISERICERTVDVRVLRMAEQVIEAPQIFKPESCLGEVQSNRPFDVPAPEMAEQLVETLKNVSWDRIKQRTVEHIGDIPVSQVMKESTEISGDFSQDEVRQRILWNRLLRSLLFHLLERSLRCLAFGYKKGYDRLWTRRLNTLLVWMMWRTTSFGRKINQMIKHAPRVQVVEKTVEEHFATIAHLASRISAILKFGDETGDETGEDPFMKVKSSTTELINKLQDALELLDKNQLAENDELGFWTGLRQ